MFYAALWWEVIDHHQHIDNDVNGAIDIEQQLDEREITYFTHHFEKEEVFLGPGVEVFKPVNQRCVRMIVDAAHGTFHLARAAARRVLGLLGRPICLELYAVGIMVPLFLAVVSAACSRCSATCCYTIAFMCASVASGVSVTVVIVNNFGKSQPLVRPVYRYLLSFPHPQ